MNLWCLTEHPSLDGEGGRLYSARWNTAGEPIVYLAASPPGALIEILVHLELEESELPPTYTLLRIAVPDRLKILALTVPNGDTWKENETLTRKLGDTWLKSRKSALARVPSSILPDTFNYLLNPLHPDAARITIAATHSAALDSRLIR
jgi:RES domain-containing protein